MVDKHMKFKFFDPDTDECVYECVARQGAMNRAKIYLFKGAEPMSSIDSEAFYALWGFMSADLSGHPLAEMPSDLRKVTREAIFDWMDKCRVDIEVPVDESERAEDGTANPTGI